MQKLTKPNNYGTLWAQNGSRQEVDAKQPVGWQVEIPLVEVMNGLQYRQDYAIGYLLQNGVPDYDNNSTYYSGQISNVDGVLYKAKQQSQGVNPTTGSQKDAYWEKVAPTWGEYLVILNRVNSADPFTQYLLKSAPQTSANYVGAGLVSHLNDNLQLVFDGTLKYKNSSTTLYNFPSSALTPSDDSNNIATTAWVKQQLRELTKQIEVAVGESIITTSSTNPAITKGYGTWVLDCQGRAIVGVSNQTDSPSWTKTVNSTSGEYSVKLTVPQMPSHNHYTDQRFNKLVAIARDIYGDPVTRQTTTDGTDHDYLDSEIGIATITPQAKILMQIKDVGGNQAHNNVQPSQTKYVWTRTA